MSAIDVRKPQPFAPWAEIVPDAPLAMTVDDLLAWPDDDRYRYELVEGVLIRMAGSGDEATSIGIELAAELRNYVRPRRLGRVTGADGVYKFPGAETGLLPDVGYYRAERRSLITDRRKPIPFAPDLAIEIASPGQTQDDLASKARIYLNGGTRLLWIVWPALVQIDVWRAGHLARPSRTLRRSDMLDGESVVPGFLLPVADVFADPLE